MGLCGPLLWITACLAITLLAPRATAQTPTPDDTLRAYGLVERAVRAWAAPAADAAPEEATPKAVGACITLKLHGEVVGRGAAWSDAISGPDAPSQRVLLQAIRTAMQQAEPKLGAPNDASRDAALQLIARDVLIGVELAGPLSVIEPATWEDAEVALRPGLDGVAVRILNAGGTAAGPLRAMFPSQMMLTSMLPHRAMGAMVATAIGEGGAAAALDEPKKLRDSSGVRMFRFRVDQAAQGVPGATPSLLFRGANLHSSIPSRAELETFASRLVDHLVHRMKSEVSPIETRLVATVRPGSEEDASEASPLEQLVAAYAVVKYLEVRGEDGIRKLETDPIRFVRAAGYAGRSGQPATPALYWLSGDTILDPHKAAIIQRRSQAAVEMAVLEQKPSGDQSDEMDRYFRALDLKTMPESLRPIVVLAFSASQDAPGTGYAKRTDAILRSLYKGVPEGKLVALMPWLGWAEIARTRLAWLENEPTDIPSAVALRRMRDQCWDHQLEITTAGEDAIDMVGGIVFTGGFGEGRGVPYPTWQCARPLAFLATMLRDARLTDANKRTGEIVHLMQAARYLRQLQVDETSAWMYPDPKLAIGGIRASVWDNSLPIDATSMTLLYVTELLKSLDELSRQPAAPSQPVAK